MDGCFLDEEEETVAVPVVRMCGDPSRPVLTTTIGSLQGSRPGGSVAKTRPRVVRAAPAAVSGACALRHIGSAMGPGGPVAHQWAECPLTVLPCSGSSSSSAGRWAQWPMGGPTSDRICCLLAVVGDVVGGGGACSRTSKRLVTASAVGDMSVVVYVLVVYVLLVYVLLFLQRTSVSSKLLLL